MKILFSQLQELIPDLTDTPKEAGEIFTMIGYMMDRFEEVIFNGKKDYLLGLEIRQNRPDCLSIIGLAKELAAYHGLQLQLPQTYPINEGKSPVDIAINAKDYVWRVMAYEVKGVDIKESPVWLKEFLSFYDMNSINTLVDISNFVMLMTGEPSHIFDKDKIEGTLRWALNKKHESITTLDGSVIPLSKNMLVIEDDHNPLALAGMVGGDKARITESTTHIIIEMGVYDRALVTQNSREVSITTEASRRLEKDLDPNNMDYGMKMLMNMIQEYGDGEVVSQVFNFYENPYIPPVISFDSSLPSRFAGVSISEEQSIEILKNLGCVVEGNSPYMVTPPVNRLDLQVPEDLVEEVTRIYGYYNIPSDQVPSLKVVNDITPVIAKLDEQIKDILVSNGLDEILSWPLTGIEENIQANYKKWEVIKTQNSVNEEFPDLRQTLLAGLFHQFKEYKKNNLNHISIFEIGKVFGKQDGEYMENESLGLLIHDDGQKVSLDMIRGIIETVIRLCGFSTIQYRKSKHVPLLANPYSIWDIFVDDVFVGIIGKSRQIEWKGNTYFAEIDLSILASRIGSLTTNPIVEVTTKIITLDANLEKKQGEEIDKIIGHVRSLLPLENIWNVEVIDIYPLKDTTRYTIRVSYNNMSDQEAKKLHVSIFGE